MYLFYRKSDFKKILPSFGVNYFLDDKIVMDTHWITNVLCNLIYFYLSQRIELLNNHAMKCENLRRRR